jgi:glycosyltransferase involved in cell wall biosynthesis
MKVLHVIPSVSPKRGGPSFALRSMAQGLAERGVDVHIAATDDDGPGRAHVPLARPVVRDGITTWYFPRQTRFYTFSWPLTRWLTHQAPDYDVVHIHALFSYAALPAAWAAACHGVPYVVRPLGTLNRWGMRRRRPLLKRVSFRLIERRILNGAAAIHYTSEQERAEAQDLGVSTAPAVIPLGIDLAEFARPRSPDRFLRSNPHLAGRTVLLFLSRLDPKKGLDILLPAFSRVLDLRPDAALVLAGNGDEGFVSGLREEVRRLGLDGDVVFAGLLTGVEKLSALAAAAVFVLPSYSENFGVAPVEAMAAAIPVVLSDQVGISKEVRESGAGLVVSAAVETLSHALARLMGDRDLRCRMGENGRRLAQTRFSSQAAAGKLVALYERIRKTRERHVA